MSKPKGRAEALEIDTSAQNGPSQNLPPIAAVFLVKFDVRKGYTIAWKQSIHEVDLEGVVEYKSLPSGLHNVKEDLVYFIHDEYAGISAFLNEPAAKSERNASMLSVGVLVPLEHGRMGKSWLHVENLKNFAKQQMKNMDDTQRLEEYWSKHRIEEGQARDEEAVTDSPITYKASSSNGHVNGSHRSNAPGDAAALMVGHQSLSSYHPALSLTDLVKSFGPLLFPLYRAALLRKRLLLVGDAPVHRTCDFVYDISVLSSIPKSLASLLPVDGTPSLRLKPIFSVGVQDIPQLSQNNLDTSSTAQTDHSWIACTTDDVLATKPELYDMLVVLPASYTKEAETKVYPKLVESSPSLARSFPSIGLKATQRDARRYQALRAGLRSIRSSKPNPEPETVDDADVKSVDSQASSTLSGTRVVEPTSWSLVAYTSIIWWASAGEKKSGPTEQQEAEEEQDRELLMPEPDTMQDSQQETSQEIALVSYFHRLTSLIFTTISDAISRQDGEEVRRDQNTDLIGFRDATEEAVVVDGEPADRLHDVDEADDSQPLLGQVQDDSIEITQADMTGMGLDIWSAADRIFVEELIKLWWGRKADVKGGQVECCGLRLL